MQSKAKSASGAIQLTAGNPTFSMHTLQPTLQAACLPASLTSRCLLICCSALLVGRGRLQCMEASRLPRSDSVAAALASLQVEVRQGQSGVGTKIHRDTCRSIDSLSGIEVSTPLNKPHPACTRMHTAAMLWHTPAGKLEPGQVAHALFRKQRRCPRQHRTWSKAKQMVLPVDACLQCCLPVCCLLSQALEVTQQHLLVRHLWGQQEGVCGCTQHRVCEGGGRGAGMQHGYSMDACLRP